MSVEDDAKYAMEEGHRYKLMTLNDFQAFRKLALSHDSDWATHYSDKQLTVQSKPPEDKSTSLNIIRARRVMPHVAPLVLYDQLQDAQYRATWDKNMMEGYNIVQLDEHNDIGYYAAKFPWPLANRDFCNMRAWMEFTNGEYIIMNHSVPHKRCPEKKGFVRAKSILTGFYMQPYNNGKGTMLIYVTHSDPCGSIPHAIINFAMTKGAPMILNNCEKCSEEYPAFVEKTYAANYTFPWRTDKVDWGLESELTSIHSTTKSVKSDNDKVNKVSNTSITRNKNVKNNIQSSLTSHKLSIINDSVPTSQSSKVERPVENNNNSSTEKVEAAGKEKTTKNMNKGFFSSSKIAASNSLSSFSNARIDEEDDELSITGENNIETNSTMVNNATNQNNKIAQAHAEVSTRNKNTIISTSTNLTRDNDLRNSVNENKANKKLTHQSNNVCNGGVKELDNIVAVREANSIRQFKAFVEDSMLAVDRSFAHEGRVPSSDEYKVRLKYTLEGIRQTIPQESTSTTYN